MIAIDVPRAAYIIDYQGTMSFDRAVHGVWLDGSTYRYPGTASPFHPQSMWIRFTTLDGSKGYLIGAPGIGSAEVFDASGKVIATFGMRIPFADRQVARVPPTARLPDTTGPATYFVHAWLDDESPVTPIVSIESAQTVALRDNELELMSSFALLFIGVFVSLAAANVFVFFFVREPPYVIYSFMMLANALFAATYVHGSSWRWLWPHGSLPHAAVQGSIAIIAGIALLAFTRAFLHTKRIMPQLDRVAVLACTALIVVAAFCSVILPSLQFGPIPARTVFLVSTIVFVVITFALGIVALKGGSIEARFFVASNGAVSLAVALLVLATISHYDVSTTANFVMLMNGQAVEGWLLFGALAYRLQQVIIRNAEEHRLATTDALTGISNRRSFDAALAREWDRCARSRSNLAVLMIDVDHFKKFNDSYGHIEGDVCLKRVAQAIRTEVQRPSDVCARYGGEEFAVILPDTDAKGALILGEAIGEAVRMQFIPHDASETKFVTVSVGCAAMIPYTGDSPQLLIRSADAALYQAKESGRDRVFVK